MVRTVKCTNAAQIEEGSTTNNPGVREEAEEEEEPEDFSPPPKGKNSAPGWLGGWGMCNKDNTDDKPQEPDWINDWTAPVKVEVGTEEPDSD